MRRRFMSSSFGKKCWCGSLCLPIKRTPARAIRWGSYRGTGLAPCPNLQQQPERYERRCVINRPLVTPSPGSTPGDSVRTILRHRANDTAHSWPHCQAQDRLPASFPTLGSVQDHPSRSKIGLPRAGIPSVTFRLKVGCNLYNRHAVIGERGTSYRRSAR